MVGIPGSDSENPSAPDAAWAVSRAEFDGWASKLPRSNNLVWFWVATPLAIVGGGMMWISPEPLVRIASLVLVGFTLWKIVRNRRHACRIEGIVSEIWRSGGAVCPRCQEPLAGGPCVHGLKVDDREVLREYWEAAIRGDIGGLSRGNALIEQRYKPRGFVRRLRHLRESMVMSIMDPSKPLWHRLLGGVLGFGFSMALIMLGMQWLMRGSVPSLLEFAMTVFQYGFGMGGFMIAGVAWTGIGVGRNRCKACGQIVAIGRETHPCPECGADLRAAGAIVSGERRRDMRTAIKGAAIALLAFFTPLVLQTSLFARLMPAELLMLQYELGSPTRRFGIVMELERRTLDPETARGIAERLLSDASTTEVQFQDNSFIGNALLAGTLGADIAERVLRTTTDIRIEAPAKVRRGEPFVVRITPVQGTKLCQLTHRELFTWAGIEVDGVLKPAPATWASQSVSERKPNTIQMTLDQPGTHRLRLRAFVTLVPFGATSRTAFDDAGVFQPHAGAVGTIELSPETEVVVD
jgi:hypothetical protein